jgi:hypothetical protein
MFLPQAVKDKLPDDIVNLILTFLPKQKKKRGHISPSLQRELEKLQKLTLKGKCGMYLREFGDFSLNSDMY